MSDENVLSVSSDTPIPVAAGLLHDLVTDRARLDWHDRAKPNVSWDGAVCEVWSYDGEAHDYDLIGRGKTWREATDAAMASQPEGT